MIVEKQFYEWELKVSGRGNAYIMALWSQANPCACVY